MGDVDTIIIEQDPKCAMRFRITLSEQDLMSQDPEVVSGTIYQRQAQILEMKASLGMVASFITSFHPAYDWANEHGGRKTVRRITYRPKVSAYHRAGLSITFKERNRAALFKLCYAGR